MTLDNSAGWSVGHLLLFSSRWCYSASLCFLLQVQSAFLGLVVKQHCFWLRKVPSIYLVMGHHHYGGGMWQVVENPFCKHPELPSFSAEFLALPGSARACEGRRKVHGNFSSDPLAVMAVSPTVLKFPSHLYLGPK